MLVCTTKEATNLWLIAGVRRCSMADRKKAYRKTKINFCSGDSLLFHGNELLCDIEQVWGDVVSISTCAM